MTRLAESGDPFYALEVLDQAGDVIEAAQSAGKLGPPDVPGISDNLSRTFGPFLYCASNGQPLVYVLHSSDDYVNWFI